ncbi:MAG TPA: DUF72 domain-containing protein [Nitrososphaera sp.]|jgi:uncharacterized protein YecE (DUF72 family)|nr:DUF72 domain-containing protein [Nitrososphaera sp.]
MSEVLIGCSGWSYGDKAEKGGWVGSFYPNTTTKRLPYYSQYFNTVEIDATYYDKFYKYMTQDTFKKLAEATPDNFQFSTKVPETITREKKLGEGSLELFNEFLDKTAPLRKAGKLGAILFQMSPNFTVDDFKNAEIFLDRLPRDYDYALEFRHASWQTEGAPELLKHYNIASVMTDSPDPKLKFLAEPIVTADHAFIRFHGRNEGFWYNYLYIKKELEPWAEKVKITKDLKIKKLRIYFNNHYGGKAVLNALQFKEMLGEKLSKEQLDARQRAETHLTGKDNLQQWFQ